MNLITHHFTTSHSDGKHETEKTHSSPVKKKARQDVLSKLTQPFIQGTLPTHDKPIQSQQPSRTPLNPTTPTRRRLNTSPNAPLERHRQNEHH
jgi:hypothetical protein